jgi:hypothetical protein
VVCQVFVLLACRTTFDVFCDPGSGARPEVFFIDVSNCFVSPGVAVDRTFVPYVHQFVFQHLIRGNNEASSLDVSPEWFIWIVYAFDWVGSDPFVH